MNQPAAVELREGLVPAPASSVSGLTPDGLRMLRAIDELPEDEREVFDLVRHPGDDAGGGRRVARRLGGDGEAAVEPRPAAPDRATGRPPPGREAAGRDLGAYRQEWVLWVSESRHAAASRSPVMAVESRVQQLLDELCDSGCTPEEVCAACPELLPEVRRRWLQMCAVEAELDALFPTPGPDPGPAPIPPLPGMRAPSCRRYRAMRWRPSSAAGAWAWSTRPGTSDSTASSPSRC